MTNTAARESAHFRLAAMGVSEYDTAKPGTDSTRPPNNPRSVNVTVDAIRDST
jgi:hypothetical protein